MNEVLKWELRGVGHADPRLIGEGAVINEAPEGTSVIGTWDPEQLTDLVLTLMSSGFELISVRRFDGHL